MMRGRIVVGRKHDERYSTRLEATGDFLHDPHRISDMFDHIPGDDNIERIVAKWQRFSETAHKADILRSKGNPGALGNVHHMRKRLQANKAGRWMSIGPRENIAAIA